MVSSSCFNSEARNAAREVVGTSATISSSPISRREQYVMWSQEADNPTNAARN
jgi:hypothetical protein